MFIRKSEHDKIVDELLDAGEAWKEECERLEKEVRTLQYELKGKTDILQRIYNLSGNVTRTTSIYGDIGVGTGCLKPIDD